VGDEPTLLLVTGPPGTGKSTLAEAAARTLGAPVLAWDWVMAGMTRFDGVQAALREMDHLAHRSVGWSILWNLAVAQLRHGRSVVLDGTARDPEVDGTRRTAADTGARGVVAVTSCRDRAVHRARIEGRSRGIPGWHELAGTTWRGSWGGGSRRRPTCASTPWTRWPTTSPPSRPCCARDDGHRVQRASLSDAGGTGLARLPAPGARNIAFRVRGTGCRRGEHWEPMARVFADRRDAGRRLAHRLGDLADPDDGPPDAGEGPAAHGDASGAAAEARRDVVVLGLPRGGVPVAAEVAAALGAPLDILVVGKVGVPGHEELALAAVADDGTVVVNAQVQAATGLTDGEVDALARRQVAALARRGAELRPGRDPLDLAGRTVVVVDDGMATGATMRVALEVVRHRGPRRVIAAVPVAALDAAGIVAPAADRVVCVLTPRDFHAVGPWYADFTQVTDAEVRAQLAAPLRTVEGVDDP